MPNFIKQVSLDGEPLEFSFVRILTVNGPKYFTMVARGDREFHFIIEKQIDEWIINDAPLVPDWIHDLKDLLIGAVLEHESQIK